MRFIASDDHTRWKAASSTGLSTFPINCTCSPANCLQKLTFRYGEIDYIYGWKAYNEHNGFTNAQSLMNVVELLMQICYLRLRKRPGHENPALLIGYSVSLMSLAKTALYWLQEYYSGCGSHIANTLAKNLGTRKSDIILGIGLFFSGLYRMEHGSYFLGS